jgi:hypothetical protein
VGGKWKSNRNEEKRRLRGKVEEATVAKASQTAWLGWLEGELARDWLAERGNELTQRPASSSAAKRNLEARTSRGIPARFQVRLETNATDILHG